MRSWLVIPAVGVVTAAGALTLGAEPLAAAAAATAGAALAAAIRLLAGDSPAAITGAAIAPLLAIASIADRGGIHVLPCLALAAACWTISELARPTASPLVALLPAIIAAVLEPAAVTLVPIAATRILTGPSPAPRGAIAGPILGGLLVALAVVAGAAHDGAFATLGERWFGNAPAPIAAATLAHRLGDALGPLTAVAAIAGLAMLARLRLAELAIATCVAGALLVDLRAGTIGPLTLGLAALCAGLALGRFAGLIRISSGQAIAGVTAGALLLVPPTWSAIDHGPVVPIARASR